MYIKRVQLHVHVHCIFFLLQDVAKTAVEAICKLIPTPGNIAVCYS